MVAVLNAKKKNNFIITVLDSRSFKYNDVRTFRGNSDKMVEGSNLDLSDTTMVDTLLLLHLRVDTLLKVMTRVICQDCLRTFISSRPVIGSSD